MLPGFFHDTLGERDRARGDRPEVRRVHRRAFATPPTPRRPAGADRVGYTRDEADRLASPLPLLSPQRPLLGDEPRLDLQWAAWLSHGIEARASRPASIPARRSTTSTRTRREGIGPIGRMIDRTFLDAIGWRGIRQRKLHLEELICAPRWRAEGRRTAACTSSTSPPAMAATCSTPSPKAPSQPASVRLHDYIRAQRRGRPQADRRDAAAAQRRLRPGRRLRRRRCSRRLDAGARPRHRLRALRTVCRQRA